MGATLAGRRIAVTGASGFIGAHTVAELHSQGADVLACDQMVGWRSILTSLVDAGEVDFLETGRGWPYPDLASSLSGVDTVVHLGYAEPDAPTELGQQAQESGWNLRGTVELLDQLPESVRLFCFASSSLVYGRGRSHPLKECHLPKPDSAYAQAKVGVERALLDWANNTGNRALILRLSTVYGPMETVPRAVPNFIRRALAGLAPQVAIAEDARDYVHVQDVAAAIALSTAADLDQVEVLNVGTGCPTTTQELAELVSVMVAGCPDPDIAQADRDPVRVVCDVDLLENRLGFKPRFTLASGLRTEIDWIRDRPHLWASPC